MEGQLRFKGVLVDLWGTLAPESSPGSRASHFQDMARILGVDRIAFERDWAGTVGPRCLGALGSLEQSIRRAAVMQGIEPSEDALRQAVRGRLEYTASAIGASARLLPALDSLRGAGLRLAVVSDTTEETVRVWPSLPLAGRFETTVFSCLNGFCKPDPRAYRLALEGLGLRADDCAFVGDDGSQGELAGAKALGIEAFEFHFPGGRGEPSGRSRPSTGWSGPAIRDFRELLEDGGRGRGVG